jgi:hypothetical protein
MQGQAGRLARDLGVARGPWEVSGGNRGTVGGSGDTASPTNLPSLPGHTSHGLPDKPPTASRHGHVPPSRPINNDSRIKLLMRHDFIKHLGGSVGSANVAWDTFANLLRQCGRSRNGPDSWSRKGPAPEALSHWVRRHWMKGDGNMSGDGSGGRG